ncbi:hypothetical protein AVEN_47480-1 [Araneus ventricosus]|uniref:Uncharacterized protein n=1 Tax=Araneus ventricosus TaxID=182803 RepID=A0A4Y2Q5Z4_ARAVE|nr:hypothetical protein AVEN_47480-1 [Araneus ventricosus]
MGQPSVARWNISPTWTGSIGSSAINGYPLTFSSVSSARLFRKTFALSISHAWRICYSSMGHVPCTFCLNLERVTKIQCKDLEVLPHKLVNVIFSAILLSESK